MSVLRKQLEAVLLPGMSVPEPLAKLFDWIEDEGFFLDRDGQRIGFLFPPDRVRKERTETTRPGGTQIAFCASGNAGLEHWFGHGRPGVLNRLCVFARTGGDGSMAAFWLDDDSEQRIVHMGSGSGSTLVCVLADDAVEFLRLLAIGYDEIAWGGFAKPPDEVNDTRVYPNDEFQDWVTDTFAVEIPASAAEIVRHPSKMGDKDSADVFCRWVERNTA